MKLKYAIPLVLLALLVLVVSCKRGTKVEPTAAPPPPVAVDTTTKVVIPPPPPEKPPVAPLQLSTVYFDYDKYDIRADAREILSQNGKSLTEHPTATIRIEGNCDERGTEQYNLALGEKRANAAKDYLTNYGIDVTKITTISYGKERSLAKGHNEEAWSKNRRDDFVILSE